MAIVFVDENATGLEDGSTWENAYTDIQDAIDDSSCLDEIWIKEGVYYLSAELDIPQRVIHGGFDSGLVSNQGDKDERTKYTTIYGQSSCRCATIKFDLPAETNGYDVEITRCYFIGGYVVGNGGGVLVDSSDLAGNLIMTDCGIQNCTGNHGGGIYIHEATTTAVFTRCEITDNTAADYNGGGVYCKAYGGGDDEEYRVEFNYCDISRNHAIGAGGGVCTYRHIFISRCHVTDNLADNDAGNVWLYDGSQIIRSVITGGEGEYTGGVYLYAGTGLLVNNTICDNVGNGVTRVGGTGVLTNCEVRGNDTQVSGTWTVTYSNVEDGHAGTGNVDGDPHYLGLGSNPYAKTATSVSVDSANQGATGYESADIVNNDPYDDPDTANTGAGSPAYADMGAYEFQGFAANTFDMSNYFVSMGVGTANQQLTMYAIVRLPYGFRSYADDNFIGLKTLGHAIGAEVEQDEVTGSLTEYYFVGDIHVGTRSTDAGVTTTPPTRSLEFSEWCLESAYGDYVAINRTQIEAPCFDNRFDGAQYCHYVFVKMVWKPVNGSQSDDRKVFNIDIEQIQPFDFPFRPLSPSLGLNAADYPLSAWLINDVLQNSLDMLQYEARNATSIPVFGQNQSPVV